MLTNPRTTRLFRKLLACGILVVAGCSGGAETPDPLPEASSWLDDGIPMIEASSTLPTCPACTIELDSLFTIGNPSDTVFPADGLTFIVEGAEHRFYVAPLSVEQKIGQYDRHGRLLAMFGGHGEAPGKYYAPAAIAPSPDSMLLVLDINKVLWFRLDSLTAELGPLGDFPNQGGLLAFRDRRFVTTSSGGMPGELLYSEPKPDGTQIGVSVSPHISMTDTESELRMWRAITGSDSVWLTASWHFAPVVELWNEFRRVRRFVLPAPWWPTGGAEGTTPFSTTIAPLTRAIRLDAAGRLWTLTSVPDSAYVAAAARTTSKPVSEREILQQRSVGAEPLTLRRFNTVVAVYQLSDTTVSLVASQRFEPTLVSFLSDTILAGTSRSEPGMTQLSIYSYTLRGLSP